MSFQGFLDRLVFKDDRIYGLSGCLDFCVFQRFSDLSFQGFWFGFSISDRTFGFRGLDCFVC